MLQYKMLHQLLPILIPLAIIDLTLKAIACWKAAKHDQLYWFIAIVILNTVGILPIVYLLFFQKTKKKK